MVKRLNGLISLKLEVFSIEHKDKNCSLDSTLKFWSICSLRNMSSLVINEPTKVSLTSYTVQNVGLSFLTRSVTYPLSLMKTRLQNQDASNRQYKGMIDCGRKIIHREGVRRLFGLCYLKKIFLIFKKLCRIDLVIIAIENLLLLAYKWSVNQNLYWEKTFKYEKVISIILNRFNKEHCKVLIPSIFDTRLHNPG